jgi:hypothetical protein
MSATPPAQVAAGLGDAGRAGRLGPCPASAAGRRRLRRGRLLPARPGAARAGLGGAGPGHAQRLTPRRWRPSRWRTRAGAGGRCPATRSGAPRCGSWCWPRASRQPARSPGAKAPMGRRLSRGLSPCGCARPGQAAPRRRGRAAAGGLAVAEWPPGEPEPVKYWLASLPVDTPLERLVGLAKLLSRVEGRAGPGPLRGPLLQGLAPSRDAGVGRPRLRHAAAPGPKSGCVGLTTFAVLRELQLLLACWAGACPLCLRRLPRSTAWLHPSAAPT